MGSLTNYILGNKKISINFKKSKYDMDTTKSKQEVEIKNKLPK